MAAASGKYIESLIMKLNPGSDSRTKKALIALTKLTKDTENVYLFCLKGGLKRLLTLVQLPNITIIADMALSVLANCAREKESRREIRRLDGIAVLADVLKNSKKTSILNRTSRALANLAEDELSVQVMEEIGVIPELVKLLIKMSDSDCKQSIIRALRMVCTNPERKQPILDLDAVKTIMEMLQSGNSSLVRCCIKTVAELTKECSKEFAQQVQDCGGVKFIVMLANSDSSQVRNLALLSLSNLAFHAHVRVCIGSEGGIEALTKQLKRDESGHVTVKVIEGLCYCCREGINRLRVRDSSALELLLKIFLSGKWLSLEKKIVTAFAQFCHSETDLDILLNGGLVPGLVNHLNRIVYHIPSRNDSEDHDDSFTDHQSFTADFYSDYPSRTMTTKGEFSDVSAETLKDENFLKKLEETAREVTDTKVTGRLSKFKRRLKLKPSPIPTTPPPGVCTIGQSVFSFASRQTDTTTLVSVCTSSRSVSSLASSCSNSTNLSTSSCPRVLSSHQVSAQTQNTSDPHELTKNVTSENPKWMCIVKSQNLELKHSLMPKTLAGSGDLSTRDMSVTNVKCQNQPMNESLESPLSPKAQSGLHHRSPGQSALALLLRISHMTDPSTLVVNRLCIQALLDYLCLVSNPSPKCVRILNLLATNPLCFRALIVHGAVVAFHHRLCLVYNECQETAAPVTAEIAQELQDHKTNPQSHSFQEQSLQKPSSSTSTEDSLLQSKDKINASGTDHSMSLGTQSHCHETGTHLLQVLSNQAQTPCGKGEIANLLLTGSKEEHEECVLALPLLCRTRKLRQHMLVERKGLRMLCDLFTSVAPTGETFTSAVESLIVLANDLEVTFPASVTHKEVEAISKDLIAPTVEGVNTGTYDELHSRKLLKQFKEDSSDSPSLSPDSEQDHSSCLYHNSCFGSSDVEFLMDKGEKVAAHKEVVRSASDVFTAMLSQHFIESTQYVISIRDISADVFKFAMHHIYGCKIIPNEQISSEVMSSVSFCEVLRMKVKEIQVNRNELQFFLELLTFSDRFMLDKLRTLCEKFLVNFIDATTVVQIYNYGLQMNSPHLCVHCLSYLLTIRISNLPDHLHTFKELFLCTEREHVVEHLYELLLSYLKF